MSNGQSNYGSSMMSRPSATSHFNNHSRNDERHRDGRETNNYQSTAEKDNTGIRETGIVEKLLHSYGFLQSCERNARFVYGEPLQPKSLDLFCFQLLSLRIRL